MASWDSLYGVIVPNLFNRTAHFNCFPKCLPIPHKNLMTLRSHPIRHVPTHLPLLSKLFWKRFCLFGPYTTVKEDIKKLSRKSPLCCFKFQMIRIAPAD